MYCLEYEGERRDAMDVERVIGQCDRCGGLVRAQDDWPSCENCGARAQAQLPLVRVETMGRGAWGRAIREQCKAQARVSV